MKKVDNLVQISNDNNLLEENLQEIIDFLDNDKTGNLYYLI